MVTFTHPLRAFCQPAMATAEYWRTAIGIVVFFGVLAVFVILSRIGVYAIFGGFDALAQLDSPHRELSIGLGNWINPTTPMGSIAILASFCAVWPALWLVVHFIHKRNGNTLFGPTGRLNWAHFRIGLAVSIGAGIVAWVPMILTHEEEFVNSQHLGLWFILLPIVLPLLFVQTTAEELFFRGYLLQQFGARAWSPIGWSLFPSILFALGHPNAAGIFWISPFHLVFGLAMAAVTSRTANLGTAMGLHFGNNLINIVLVTKSSQLSGVSLFSFAPDTNVQPALWAYCSITILICFVFMARQDMRFVKQWKAAKAYREKLAEQEDSSPDQ